MFKLINHFKKLTINTINKTEKYLRENIISILVVMFLFLIFFAYVFEWVWVGVSSYKKSEDAVHFKTLWDWLQLLIVPLILAIGGYFINLSIKKFEFNQAKKRAKLEKKITKDRNEEIVLSEYFDRMSNLLLERQLKNDMNEEVIIIARTWTITVLRRVNKERRSIIINFLRDNSIFIGENVKVKFSKNHFQGANLSQIDLHSSSLKECIFDYANLNYANFNNADLTNANCKNVKLNRATLYKAKLEKADLKNAKLKSSFLERTNMFKANLEDADVRYSSFKNANLKEAIFSYAKLNYAVFTNAKLNGAYLDNAKLDKAVLINADLRGANLEGASFDQTIFDYSDLTGAEFDICQLRKVKSLFKTIFDLDKYDLIKDKGWYKELSRESVRYKF